MYEAGPHPTSSLQNLEREASAVQAAQLWCLITAAEQTDPHQPASSLKLRDVPAGSSPCAPGPGAACHGQELLASPAGLRRLLSREPVGRPGASRVDSPPRTGAPRLPGPAHILHAAAPLAVHTPPNPTGRDTVLRMFFARLWMAGPTAKLPLPLLWARCLPPLQPLGPFS